MRFAWRIGRKLASKTAKFVALNILSRAVCRSAFAPKVVAILLVAHMVALPAFAGRKAEFIKQSVNAAGLNRTFFVHAPASYDPSRPNAALLLFVDAGFSPEDVWKMTGMEDLSEKHGFLLVCPKSVKGFWNDGRHNNPLVEFDDVAFLDAMIFTLERKWHVDPNAVYLAGFGNGGFFVQYAALRLPGKINSIASVAASLPAIVQSTQHGQKPVSLMYILGTEDPIVPFGGGPIRDGGGYSMALPASQSVQYWVKLNRCSGNYLEHDFPKLDHNDPTQVRLCAYGGGENGNEVVIVGVQGGGHAWPRNSGFEKKFKGRTSHDFDASDLICQFFLKHGLSGQ